MWDKSDHVSERGGERGREEQEGGGSFSATSIETMYTRVLTFTQKHKSSQTFLSVMRSGFPLIRFLHLRPLHLLVTRSRAVGREVKAEIGSSELQGKVTTLFSWMSEMTSLVMYRQGVMSRNKPAKTDYKSAWLLHLTQTLIASFINLHCAMLKHSRQSIFK